MVHVEKATPEMFEEVYPLFEHFNRGNPKLGKEHWRSLFNYPWQVQNDIRGFVLVDDARIVGFEALIQCERVIDGEIHWIGNCSSWHVLPEYRSSSMKLKGPQIDMAGRGMAMTAFTPKKEFEAYHKMIGCSILETHQIILLPIPDPCLLPSLWQWSATHDPVKFLPLLKDGDRQIYEDHKNLPCKHLVVWRGGEYCYLVHSKTEGPRGFSSSSVHYISDLSVFFKALEKIKLSLQLNNRAIFVTIEQRMLRGQRPRFFRRIPMKSPRWFLSNTLKAEQIDNLYSEMILLEI